MAEKADSAQIRQFLNRLKTSDKIRRSERRIWPGYAYHYTDIRNAIAVLKRGCLYSRHYLEQSNQLSVSSGSNEVLAATNSWVKDCVRLYFRPKTPTQYWAEGIRSQEQLAKSKFPDAHCPIPIFFLFDLTEVLSRRDAKFSDKGLASSNARILSTAAELEGLEWTKVYHNSWVNMADPNEVDIIACRNAEVIVPQRLELDSLRYIYCRSTPELETLMHLLPANVQQQYKSRIFSSQRSDHFYRQHTYLENVRLSADHIHLRFSPDTSSKGPFKLRFDFFSLEDEKLPSSHNDQFYVASPSGSYSWKAGTPTTEYKVRLHLDDALLYANSYVDWDNIPF